MEKQSATPETTRLPKSYFRRWWNFAKEMWNDHDFWIRALAVKGGASAVAVAGAVGIAYSVSLPVVLAAAGISACTGLIGFGLYGVVVGAASANDKLGEIYAKTVSGKKRAEKQPSIKRLHQRLMNNARVQKMLKRPLMQKFLASRPWQFMRRQVRKEQNVFMAGLAGTGSAFWGAVSAVALAAVLPALAIGTIFTFSTMIAVGGLMSGAFGIYLSVQSLVGHFRKKKAVESAAAPVTAEPEKESSLKDRVLTPSFDAAVKKPALKIDPSQPGPDAQTTPPAP